MTEANDDEDLYDEFGNYIGPELDSSSDEESSDEETDVQQTAPDDASDVSDDNNNNAMVLSGELSDKDETGDPVNAIVLHEDKEHYLSAEETYGEGVRTAVLDEDAMDLDTPIVEPVVTKSHHADAGNTSPIEYIYSDEYLTTVLSNETTRNRRGIAIVGHFHHGKSSLVDFLMEPTLQKPWGPRASLEDQIPRFTDMLKSEQKRQMSLVSTPMTLLLSDTRGKTHGVTLVDCPGHTQFHDESVAALRSVDGVVVVVDAVEGIMMHTELLLKQIVNEGLPITLCISKVDRLITELKLPPRDAYFKLLHVVEAANKILEVASRGRYDRLLDPSKGNVCFASGLHGWLFTLPSYAQLYADHNDDKLGNLSMEEFSRRLWGDWYWDESTKQFHDSPKHCSSPRTERSFVTLCLGPLYKIYTACLGEREEDANTLLRGLGVLLKRDQLRSSARPLLRAALSKFFELASCGFIDMVVQHTPCPAVAANGKVARCYSGPMDSEVAKDMIKCNQKGRLVIHVCKLYSAPDGSSFGAFGRIYSGTVKPGQKVKVLGEGYEPDEDDEDMAVASIEAVSIPRGRSLTNVTLATSGNWVLLQGVDATIAKTATIVGMPEESTSEEEDNVHIFTPLRFPFAGGESTMKIALEPLNPAELPKMVEGLRRVGKAYPMVRTRVEESGEHVLFGTGELYMDCVLHDLRHVYTDIEVKVADPVVALRETIIETSSLKCFAETANKRNKLTLIAEPLDDGMSERLEAGRVKTGWEKRKQSRFFQNQYGWDLLSSRSVWAFGDSPTRGTNLLMDDTLPSEVDKQLLDSCRSSIVQGFQWATREGPLCEEPVRGSKIKILDAVLAEKSIHRGGGQVIPTARRAVHSSILTATPRLMEPIYRLQIQCPGEIVDSIQNLLKRRRGHLVRDRPIPGTFLFDVKGFIPMLDSFGFETDLRTFTQGQAMVHSIFDHWDLVPGDPLDKNIILHPLEPSPSQHLARELLLKTRRRKGLSEDISINKFFDDAMRAQLASAEDTANPIQLSPREGDN